MELKLDVRVARAHYRDDWVTIKITEEDLMELAQILVNRHHYNDGVVKNIEVESIIP